MKPIAWSVWPLIAALPLAGDDLINNISYGLDAVAAMLLAAVILMYLRIKRIRRECENEITEAKAEAVEASKAKDVFLANVSHETRTPMNAIIGLSHILLKSELSTLQRNNIYKIKRSAEMLLAITNDILDFSKIEAGKLQIEHIRFDLNTTLTDIADMISVSACEKHLDLVFEIAPDLPEKIHCDPLRLSQILMNLLNNAIKFTQEGSVTLRITAQEGDTARKGLTFEVIDTGIGMTEEQLGNLFKAFSQADNKISRKYGGTGLGLAISKRLSEKLGGTLDVASTYRVGTTFTLRLPDALESEASEQEIKRFTRLLSGKQILIADQCKANAAALAETFVHFDAVVKIVENTGEIEHLLQWNQFDAVCIDSRLITHKALTMIRKEDTPPFILLKYEILSNTYDEYVAAIISKPFTPQAVLNAFVSVFGKQVKEHTLESDIATFDDIQILSGSTILLVEDNEGNRMVVEGLLEESGIKIMTADNGQKAVEQVFQNGKKIELILMDINMPIMDGYSATSIIREYQKYDNIPIIAMTANIAESDMEKAKGYGMQGYLSKPIDVSAFYKTLRRFIEPKVDAPAPAPSAAPVRPRPAETVSTSVPSSAPVTLPGVDTQDGLGRINGNLKAYMNVLRKFADLFNNVTQELQHFADASAYSEGQALAHNLKGLSGNIGAKKLFELAKALEESFKEHGGEFDALIRSVDQEIRPIIVAIRQLKSDAGNAAAEKKVLSSDVRHDLLQSLYESARKKKAMEVKKLCSELVAYTWPESDRKTVESIAASAAVYRFDQVVSDLETMLPGIEQQ